jgi:hypothetical protein
MQALVAEPLLGARTPSPLYPPRDRDRDRPLRLRRLLPPHNHHHVQTHRPPLHMHSTINRSPRQPADHRGRGGVARPPPVRRIRCCSFLHSPFVPPPLPCPPARFPPPSGLRLRCLVVVGCAGGLLWGWGLTPRSWRRPRRRRCSRRPGQRGGLQGGLLDRGDQSFPHRQTRGPSKADER